MPRWVKERHETNKLPWASSTLLPSFWNILHKCTKCPIKEVLVRERSNIIQEEKSGTSYVIYHRIRKERTEILLPGMLLQAILNLVLQTYRSQHELYAQFPTYCGRDLESKNHIAERKLRWIRDKQRTTAYPEGGKITYLLRCTFADSMHFTSTVNISQSCSLISRIKRKEVDFLNASTCLLVARNQIEN